MLEGYAPLSSHATLRRVQTTVKQRYSTRPRRQPLLDTPLMDTIRTFVEREDPGADERIPVGDELR
jgi:hypothetical protein